MARTGTDTRAPAKSAGVDGHAPAEPASRRPRRRRHKSGIVPSFVQRLWIPVVILVVVAIAVFAVDRLHGVFGKTETTRPGSGIANDTKPFNPKRVTYEIFGVPGAVATINYLDLDAQPQKAQHVALPWTLSLTTTAPSASPNIIAQSDGDTITCRVTVDGVVKDERTSNGINAQTFCFVKSA